MSDTFDSSFDSSFDVPSGALRTDPVSWDTIEDALHDGWLVPSTGYAPSNIIWAQQAGKRPTGPYISTNITNVSESGIDWTDWQSNSFSFDDLPIVSVSGSVLNIPAHGLLTGDGPVVLKWSGTAPTPLTPLTTKYWVVSVDADHIQLAATYRDSIFPWDNSAPVPIALSSSGTGTGSIASIPDLTEHKGQGVIAKTRAVWIVTMSIQAFGGGATGGSDPMAVLAKAMIKARTIPVITALNAAGIGISDFTPVKTIGKTISMTIFEPRAQTDMKFFVAAQIEDYSDYIARVSGSGVASPHPPSLPFAAERSDS